MCFLQCGNAFVSELKQKWLTCESLPSLTESSATDWASSLQSEVIADMWPPPFLNWAETSLKPSVMVEAKLVIDFVTNKSPLHSSTISDLVTDEEISGIGGSIFPFRITVLYCTHWLFRHFLGNSIFHFFQIFTSTLLLTYQDAFSMYRMNYDIFTQRKLLLLRICFEIGFTDCRWSVRCCTLASA